MAVLIRSSNPGRTIHDCFAYQKQKKKKKKKKKITASHHRKSWIFPDHFVIPSYTLTKISLHHMRIANTHVDPYEPAPPRSPIWNSLSVKKMRTVSTLHENSEHRYEPAHPHSLIWASLSVETWQLYLRYMVRANIRISLCASARPDLDLEKMHHNVGAVATPHENSKYPYEPTHPGSLIYCLLEKMQRNWGALAIRPMRTANTHTSLRIRAAWSDFAVCWIKMHRSMRAVTTPNENSKYQYMGLRRCAPWSGICCLLEISTAKAYLINIKFEQVSPLI